MADTNGTKATATWLGEINYVGTNITNGVGGLLDSTTYDRVDFFSFKAPEEGTYELDIEAITRGFVGDVDVRITNSSGTEYTTSLVRAGELPGPSSLLRFNAEKDEILYLDIARFESNSEPAVDKTRVDYSFSLTAFNYHPNGVLLYDLKDSYNVGDTININELYFKDPDGWHDIKYGTLTIFSATTFGVVAQDSDMKFSKWEGGTTWAKASDVNVSLAGIPAGDYYVYITGQDSKGGKTEPLTQDFTITAEPVEIIGTSESDVLVGNSKDNLIWGKQGNDNLTGGDGIDKFVFDTNASFNKLAIGVDTINDFTPGVDTIVLDRTTFERLKGSTLQSNQFASVVTVRQAKDSRALITYIRSTGALFYNENGSGSSFGAGGQFADLTSGLLLTRADISVVA